MTVIDLSAYRVSDAARSRRDALVAPLPIDPLLMGRTVSWWVWNLTTLVICSFGLCALLIGMSVLAPEHAPR